MLSSIILLITINTHIPFKLIFFTALNFIQNIIIIRISHHNWMSLYCFSLLVPATNILGGVLGISHCDNIKTWVNYCACWYYDGLVQWLIFLVPISFSCMEQRYCALTTNSPAEITCPSIVVFFVARMPLILIEWHRIQLLWCHLCQWHHI